MGAIRIQARQGLPEVLWRDAMRGAAEHGRQPTRDEHDGDGNTVETLIPVPENAVIVTGGRLRGTLGVVTRHERSKGWEVACHALIVVDAEGRVTASSAWVKGVWLGETVLRDQLSGPGLGGERGRVE